MLNVVQKGMNKVDGFLAKEEACLQAVHGSRLTKQLRDLLPGGQQRSCWVKIRCVLQAG